MLIDNFSFESHYQLWVTPARKRFPRLVTRDEMGFALQGEMKKFF